MMPRIGPRSLAGQLMLVTALALLLAQAVNLALLVRGQRHERVAAIAAGAAAQIVEVRERIELGVAATAKTAAQGSITMMTIRARPRTCVAAGCSSMPTPAFAPAWMNGPNSLTGSGATSTTRA
jgi:hypothetical protein